MSDKYLKYSEDQECHQSQKQIDDDDLYENLEGGADDVEDTQVPLVKGFYMIAK